MMPNYGSPELRLRALLSFLNDRGYVSFQHTPGRSLTAREAYNIVKAAEAGRSGNPNDYRDFELAPPPHRTLRREPEAAAGR